MVVGARRRWRSPAWPALAFFAGALALFSWTLAPGLVRGDGGELQFILATLGVAHPTGYPLYSLLGWLWTQVLPWGSVAWRINLISAVCGAAAVALVYGIGYRLTRRALPALAGALFLALSPAFWVLSSVTEVYALHALFVALVLYLLLVWRDAGARRPRALLLIAFVYGLSLSHHRTMALLAPAMALFVLLESGAWRRRGQGEAEPGRYPAYGLLLAAAFVAGLVPYAHVFVQQFGRGRTVEHVLFNVILGGDFAGFLGLRSDPLRVLWDLPRGEIGLIGLGLAVLGLAWLWRRQRAAAWLLSLAWLANVAFCLFYRVPDVEDFTLPATLVLAILAGAAGGWLAEIGQVAGRLMRRPASMRGQASPAAEPTPAAEVASSRDLWGGRTLAPSIVRIALELALFAVALASVRHLPQVQAGVERRDGNIEGQARALLAYEFEPGATVAADWDLTMAVRFLRQMEGAPDGVAVSAVRPGRDQGCTWLRRSLEGGVLYVAPPVQLSRLPDGYEFLEAPPFIKIVQRAPAYSPLERSLHTQLTLEGIQRQGRLLVLRWRVEGAPLAQDYTTYAHFFDAASQPLGQQDKGPGAELSCWYPPTAWPVGQTIQDLFYLPPGTTSVRVGFYALRDGEVEAQGVDSLIQLP